MEYPKDLWYTDSHEWVRFVSDTEALMGLTDYAQNALGDLVYINLPVVGDTLRAGDPIADVESVKAVSDVYCPVDGEVAEINEALQDNPAAINETPYEAWIARITNITGRGKLMSADEYALIAKEE